MLFRSSYINRPSLIGTLGQKPAGRLSVNGLDIIGAAKVRLFSHSAKYFFVHIQARQGRTTEAINAMIFSDIILKSLTI